MSETLLMKCVKGYCKNGTIIVPTDVIEILEVNDKQNIDIDILLVKSKFTEGVLTCISGKDLVEHFVYND